MKSQLYIFIIFILNGFLIGILFDAFRITRKSFKTSDIFTCIEDIIFWILTGLILLYSIFKFNQGELRIYLFIGVFVGITLYMLIFSKLFINISIYIINVLKIMFNYLIVLPFKLLLKIFRCLIFRPIAFVLINIRKRLSNFIKNISFMKKKNKTKKDFT